VNPFDSWKMETAKDNARTAMRVLAPRTARAPVCGSASATAAAEDVGHWNADHQVGRTFYLSRFREIRIGSRERGAPKVLLCFVIASTLLERRQLRLAAKAYCLVVASAKRSAVRCVFTSIGNSLMEMRSPLL
jgi:hypothetical protein